MTKQQRRERFPEMAAFVDTFADLFEGSFVNYAITEGGYLWFRKGALDWHAVTPTIQEKRK